MENSLPNFIIPGGIRCGTSWMAHNLALHPQIYMPRKKEAHFFDRYSRYEEGIAYYRSLYRDWNGEPVVGDNTPNYLSNLYSKNDIPAMIREYLPEVRFVVLLRNPSERIISQYWHARSKWPENKALTFIEKIEKTPAFVREGFYAEHIRHYLEYFPMERFYFTLFEDIIARPDDLLKGVFAFLGVDADFSSPLAGTRINSAYSKKHEGKNWILWYLHRAAFKLGWYSLARRFESLNYEQKEQFSLETRRWLVEEVYYQPNLELQALIGKDLSHWNRLPGEE